jgi:hypothetical protein
MIPMRLWIQVSRGVGHLPRDHELPAFALLIGVLDVSDQAATVLHLPL